MRTFPKTLWALVIVLSTAGALEACTASWVTDTARRVRDTENYRAARDVSEELIDTEGWTRDETTIEAGAGTILTSVLLRGLTTFDEIRARIVSRMDERGGIHGITATGEPVTDLQGRMGGPFSDRFRAHATAHQGISRCSHRRK